MSYRPAFSAPTKRRSNRILFFLLLLNLIGWVLSGCSMAVVGQADQLPSEQRSKIYFYSAKGLETLGWQVDGVERSTFALGHVVAPGSHLFRNEVEVVEEQCVGSYYGTASRGGYGGSLNNPAGPCFERRIYGQCKGSLTTEAGRSYSIRATGGSGAVTLAVTDESTGQVAGYGSCELGRI